MSIAVVVAPIALAVYVGVAAILNICYLEDARKNGQRLRLSPGLSRFIIRFRLSARPDWQLRPGGPS